MTTSETKTKKDPFSAHEALDRAYRAYILAASMFDTLMTEHPYIKENFGPRTALISENLAELYQAIGRHIDKTHSGVSFDEFQREAQRQRTLRSAETWGKCR